MVNEGQRETNWRHFQFFPRPNLMAAVQAYNDNYKCICMKTRMTSYGAFFCCVVCKYAFKRRRLNLFFLLFLTHVRENWKLIKYLASSLSSKLPNQQLFNFIFKSIITVSRLVSPYRLCIIFCVCSLKLSCSACVNSSVFLTQTFCFAFFFFSVLKQFALENSS